MPTVGGENRVIVVGYSRNASLLGGSRQLPGRNPAVNLLCRDCSSGILSQYLDRVVPPVAKPRSHSPFYINNMASVFW